MSAGIVVLDYGSGNLRSAERALARVGASVQVTADLDAVLNCDGLVVPGVGAFAACMAGIRRVGGDKAIARRIEARRPVLGICVGMQVLFSAGVEHGIRTEGCEVWPGTVDRLDAPVLPHMGWNTVTPPEGSVLFAGIEPGTRFYFVHSYALRMRDAVLPRGLAPPSTPVRGETPLTPPFPGEPGKDRRAPGPPAYRAGGDPLSPFPPTGLGATRLSAPLVTVATHGEDFAAAVEDGLVSATQFHPEKSGDPGAAVLSNWLGTL